ncbi:MAG: hypothetical protein ACOZQL_38495 [Myxococcota bacterium]
MRSRLLLLALPALAACQNWGAVKVVITFENEPRTKCVKVSATGPNGTAISSTPGAIDRVGNQIVLALTENVELTGEVRVTVDRHAVAGCTDTKFDTTTRTVQLVRNQRSELSFLFAGEEIDDGGIDAGTDAGTDGGCDTSGCTPNECERGQPACNCVYEKVDAGTPCSLGVCNSSGVCSTSCMGVPNNTPCDDGLACTAIGSTCQNEVCQPGPCSTTMVPACMRLKVPVACAAAPSTSCELVPDLDFTSCPDGVCVAGTCQKWFVFPVDYLHTAANELPGHADAGWVIAPTDAGTPCRTVIDTTTATIVTAECGAPTLVTRVDDAGVRVFGMSSLTIAPDATLHFVGSAPVQLLVLGNATVDGLLSVAALPDAGLPAGTQPSSCSVAGPGTNAKEGGGGGGFGAAGGRGGESGGAGGAATLGTAIPDTLRGGCQGGTGFSSSSTIDGGVGGGALQVAVAETLTINSTGVIAASGSGGAPGTADGIGGGGGGSGGMVVIEARVIANAGWVTANGGGGGQGGAGAPGGGGTAGDAGAMGALDSATPAPGGNVAGSGGQGGNGGAGSSLAGTAGSNGGGGKGGGGGGGSAGVVHWKGQNSCTGLAPRFSGAIRNVQPCN